MKLKVILGSTRKGRQGEKFATWAMQNLSYDEVFETELLDLKDYQLPYYEDALPSSMIKAPYSPDIRNTWAEKIKEADAFLIITPEYNHSFPAVLKSALDAVYSEWNNKPVAFISYGGSSNGSRSVEQLRLIAIELQMAPIRNGIHIGLFTGQPVFDAKGEMINKVNDEQLKRLLDQLEWWSRALKASRKLSPIIY